MGEYSRLTGIVFFFAAAGGALWWLLGGKSDDSSIDGMGPAANRIAAPQSIVDSAASAPPRSVPPSAQPAPTTSGPVAKKPKTERKGSGRIEIVVASEEGLPVTGADVVLELVDWKPYEEPGDDLLRFEAVSGTDGTCMFADLPYGEYSARAWRATAMQSGSAILNRYSASPEEIMLELWEGLPTSGVVSNSSGDPIAGAVVHFFETDRFPGNQLDMVRAVSGRVYTNERGEFRFPILWAGEWNLYAKAEGHPPGISGTIKAGDTAVRIVLGVGASVSGKVVDELTKTGLPNIEVKLASNFERDNFTAKSDADGAFVITGVREGSYKPTIVDESLVTAGDPPILILHDGQQETGVEVVAAQGAIITGRVYDKTTGAGFAKATLYANEDSGIGIRRSDITTNSDGNYEIRGLPKGVYGVGLSEISGQQRSDFGGETVAVLPGQIYDGIDFAIEPGLSISGRVVDEKGGPVDDVGVSGESSGKGNSRYSTAQTDREGAFELVGFQSGDRVKLSVGKFGLVMKKIEDVELAGQSVRGIEIQMIADATIEGTVVEPSGKPILGAGLYALPENDEDISAAAMSRAGGVFKLTRLLGGAYKIFVTRDMNQGWREAERVEQIQLEDGQHLTGLRFVVDKAGTFEIRGRVTNRKGEGVSGAQIAASSGDNYAMGQTGGDGNYTLRNVRPGMYSMQAQHPKYSSAPLVANAGDTNANFVLEGRGTIEGRVIDANSGQAIEHFEIAVTREMVPEFNSGVDYGFKAFSDPQGGFTWKDAEPGQNTIWASASGYAKAFSQLGVQASEVTSGIVLRLYPGVSIEGMVRDAAGAAVAGAEIYDGPVDEQWRGGQQRLAVTDRSGQFNVEGMSPHVTVLSAYHADHSPGSAYVSLNSRGANHVDIVLPIGGAVAGTVRVGGQPVADARVQAQSKDGVNSYRDAQTDSSGAYLLSGLWPGTMMITVNTSTEGERRVRRSTAKTVELQNGVTTIVDFDFPGAGGSIEGYVTNSGEPVTRAYIGGVSGADEASQETIRSSVIDGYYRIDNIPPGPAVFTIAAGINDVSVSRRIHGDIAEGQVARHDIDFGTGGSVQGGVQGAPEGWITTVVIATVEVDPTVIYERDQTARQRLEDCCIVAWPETRPDGTFSTAGIEPGDYTVTVGTYDPWRADNEETIRATLRYTSATITIREGEQTTINLRLD